MLGKLRLLATAGATPKALLTISAIAFVVGSVAGWRAHKLVIDAENGRGWAKAVAEYVGVGDSLGKTGMNLETGLTDYRDAGRTISEQGATDEIRSNTKPDLFIADRVRNIKARNAAAESAIKHIN